MGTNYYARLRKPLMVPDYKERHLGKSSGGWLFAFLKHDDIQNFDQFRDWLEKHVRTGEYALYDEYECEISADELLKLIERKQIECSGNPDNFSFCENVGGYRFWSDDFV